MPNPTVLFTNLLATLTIERADLLDSVNARFRLTLARTQGATSLIIPRMIVRQLIRNLTRFADDQDIPKLEPTHEEIQAMVDKIAHGTMMSLANGRQIWYLDDETGNFGVNAWELATIILKET